MTETTTIRTLLLPELEEEFSKTRKMIDHLVEGHADFKPHEKSFSFGRLAGHTAEMAGIIHLILTSPDVDVASGALKSLTFETKPQLMAEFNELADSAITALKQTFDENFNEHWKLTYKSHVIFDGTRYQAYRIMGVNHLIHHRAQLGVYLRLLNQKVPATFGPSADEAFGG